MGVEQKPTNYGIIAVDKLFIGGQEVMMPKKLFKVAPLKNGEADPAVIGKKLNELIGALKVAGLMENE